MSDSKISVDNSLLPMLTNMIRVETAITRFPLHRLAKVSSGEEISIEEVYFEDDIEKKTTWKVRHRPGPLAYKVETLVINRRIDEIGRPIPKVMPLGSLREIGRLSNLGNNTEKVKEALRQNAFAAITAKFRYTTKSNRKRYVEVNFTRYKVVFAGEELPDGTTADQVFIIFDDDYLRIINTAQNRPLDYDFLRLLPPMAQRFYELFSFYMYAALHNRQPTAKMLYSDFCKYAPQTRQTTYEAMTKQMYKVHRHHLDQDYISKVSYLSTRTSPADWWMIYEPGERARCEYEFSKGNYVLPSGGRIPAAPPILPPATSDLSGGVTENELNLLKELTNLGVKDKLALELITQFPDRVREQIDSLPFRNVKKSISGYLIKAIRENYSLPNTLFSSPPLSETFAASPAAEAPDAESQRKQILGLLQLITGSFDKFLNDITDRQLQFVSRTINQSLVLLIQEVSAAQEIVSLNDVEERLGNLEQILNDSLLRLADESVKQEVEQSVSSYREKMTAEKFSDFFQTMLLTTLRDKHKVPRLSLFLND